MDKLPLLKEEYARLIHSLDKEIAYAIQHKEEVLDKYIVVSNEEMERIEN